MLRYYVDNELVFELEQLRPAGGDCTAPYDVHLTKNFTVGEFIQTVVNAKFKNGGTEWGYIGIAKKGSIFGDPCCEYRHGKLLYDMPDEVKDRRVVIVNASGGWTRMDYKLWIE